jgi:hypothetical protein
MQVEAMSEKKEDKIKEMVRLSRQIICRIWESVKRGEQLDGEEKRIADVLSEHPEYEDAWKMGDLLVDIENDNGASNPFLHIHLHLIVDKQIDEGTPPEVARVARELMDAGKSRHEVVHAIGKVLLPEIYDMMKHKKSFNSTHYIQNIKALLESR